MPKHKTIICKLQTYTSDETKINLRDEPVMAFYRRLKGNVGTIKIKLWAEEELAKFNLDNIWKYDTFLDSMVVIPDYKIEKDKKHEYNATSLFGYDCLVKYRVTLCKISSD